MIMKVTQVCKYRSKDTTRADCGRSVEVKVWRGGGGAEGVHEERVSPNLILADDVTGSLPNSGLYDDRAKL